MQLTRNVAAITMDLDNVEEVAVRALGGTDLDDVDDLKGTDLESARSTSPRSPAGATPRPTPSIANGTDRADRVDVSRYGSQVLVGGLVPRLSITGSEPANEGCGSDTLAGNDQVTVAPDVSDLITPLVDLGADE